MRAVIVGASSGIGRSLADGFVARGEHVAYLARRRERIEAAAAVAPDRAVAIACDVTDDAGCRAAIDEAAAALGGIDALVYTAGIGPLARIEETDAATWRAVFDTNVTGATVATTAALPHLRASQGVAAYFSSVSASMTPPWPGLAAYAVSKAALDKLIEAWRAEHPDVGFTRIVLGDCGGGDGEAQSEFPATWDGDLAIEVMTVWSERKYLSGALIDVEQLIPLVASVLNAGASLAVPSIAIIPRPAPLS